MIRTSQKGEALRPGAQGLPGCGRYPNGRLYLVLPRVLDGSCCTTAGLLLSEQDWYTMRVSALHSRFHARSSCLEEDRGQSTAYPIREVDFDPGRPKILWMRASKAPFANLILVVILHMSSVSFLRSTGFELLSSLIDKACGDAE